MIPETQTADLKSFIRGLVGQEMRGDEQPFPLAAEFSSSDWTDFLARVDREGLSGLVYFLAQKQGRKKHFPAAVWESLEKEYLAILGRNLIMDSGIEEIAQTLDDQRVPALVVRGAAFFKDVYPSPGTRPFLDIDLVLKQEDFPLAEDILRRIGYDHLTGYPFFLYRQDVHIDVHLDTLMFWRFPSWPSYINVKDPVLWDRCPSFRGLRSVRTLDLDDSVISCSEHLLGHSFSRMIWLTDIAFLIRKIGPALDWEELSRRAEAGGGGQALGLALQVLHHYRWLDVPAPVLALRPKGRRHILEKRTLSFLFQDRREHISGELLAFLAVPGWGTRLRVIRDMICVPREKFPLARTHVGIWGYVTRFAKIMLYLTGKALMCLRPAKA